MSAPPPKILSGLTNDTPKRFWTCEMHGDYEGFEYKFGLKKGQFSDSGCPVCNKIAVEKQKDEEKLREEFQRQNRIKLMFLDCGIPKRYKGCSFENYYPEKDSKLALDVAKKYTQLFETRKDSGCSLVFCGMPGTGKTHLACAIANTLVGQGFSVKYTTALKACNTVKETYSRDSVRTENQALKTFQSPHLLVVDEVGMQFGTDTEKMILYQIINARYEDVLPTIMISNLPEKELSAYIGERCVDRMREGGGAVVSFDWKSYRK